MNKIFNIVGPSGSGKTSLGILGLRPEGFPEVVSHTTRAIRVGEVEGEAYYFVDEETFKSINKIEETLYAGNYYGLSRAEIDNKLKLGSMYAITDINGAMALKRAYGDKVVSIFIDVKPELIEERMRRRGDSEPNIKSRLEKAMKDKEFENGQFCKYIVNNSGCIDDAIEQIRKIVLLESDT